MKGTPFQLLATLLPVSREWKCLVPVTGDKIGLRVSQLGCFEGWSQQLVAKALAQTPDDCCSLCVEYVQLCYV